MGKILEVKTVQANVIKILSEALKDLVPDVNLIFTKSETKQDENGDEIKTGGINAITMAMSNNVLLPRTPKAFPLHALESATRLRYMYIYI